MQKRLLQLIAGVLVMISVVSCRPSERMQIKKEGWVEYCTVQPFSWNESQQKRDGKVQPHYVVFYKGDKYIAVNSYELERPYPIEWYRTVFYGESVRRIPLIKGHYVLGEEVFEWRIGSYAMYCIF